MWLLASAKWLQGCRGMASFAILLSMFLGADAARAEDPAKPSFTVRVRASGTAELLPPLRSCVAEELSKLPEVKAVTAPAENIAFIVDLAAAKSGETDEIVSVAVLQTFPKEQFRPQLKPGMDADALFLALKSYARLRLHDLLPAMEPKAACATIVAEFGEEVLKQEYVERDD